MTRSIQLTDSTIAPGHIHDSAETFRRQVLKPLPEPFAPADITAGMENELQAAVEGDKKNVDLALSLMESGYYKTLMLRAGRGDLSPQTVADINAFVEKKQVQVWENSWVRFPRHLLGEHSLTVLEHDFLADKQGKQNTQRSDLDRFLFIKEGRSWLRLPVSYLLKLSLIEAVSQEEVQAPLFSTMANRLSRHFISDNISPEITSFALAQGQNNAFPGSRLAAEGSQRYFFTQLLIRYAEKKFKLDQSGQRIHLYFAPTPPQRQKKLNTLISDQLYCDLFLNPCLSGWARGEEKKAYMKLCHRTLCRSQLNTIAVLKEAGIITNNLVVLPNTSNTSLANNGTHITLASKSLTNSFKNYQTSSSRPYEKYFGDLAIKITEHFLPLFVGTLSAAPYRQGFNNFHPEKVLGFLPHQLEATHLRMIWRRWKKKAQLRFCGHSFTPMGPEWLDTLLSKTLGLRGDYIIDNRLIDYLVALPSQEDYPALNGLEHNQDFLKRDLFEMGIFNPQMPMYLPYRMRDMASYGFTGFEGRHFSLFPSFHNHLAASANLQALIMHLAYQWIIDGKVTHHHIPDTPFIESERRQIFFNTAIGIPTFYVRADTTNRFLKRILSLVEKQRSSRRYKGYIRIKLKAYQLACITFLKQNGGEIINQSCFAEELASIESIINGSQPSAFEILTANILGCQGKKRSPIAIDASEFNDAAETYYRTELCSSNMREGLHAFIQHSRILEQSGNELTDKLKNRLIGTCPADRFIARAGKKVIQGQASEKEVHSLLLLFLLMMEQETAAA